MWRIFTLLCALFWGAGASQAKEPSCRLFKVDAPVIQSSTEPAGQVFNARLIYGEIGCVSELKDVEGRQWGYISYKIDNAKSTIAVDGWSSLEFLQPLSLAEAEPLADIPPPSRPAQAVQGQPSEAERMWTLVKDSADVHTLEVFRQQYGAVNPLLDRLAETRIRELGNTRTAAAVPSIAPAPSSARPRAVDRAPDSSAGGRGWLGVSLKSMDAANAKRLGLGEVKGVLIVQVQTPGPAALAGLQADDIILAVDGEPTNESKDVARLIAAHPPNSSVVLVAQRGTQVANVTIQLGSLTTPDQTAASVQSQTLNYLGFTVGLQRIAGQPDAAAIVQSIKQQIDIVANLKVKPSLKEFFQSVPITLAAGLKEGGHYSREKGLEMAAKPQPGDRPYLLHELLQVFLVTQVPQGVRNTEFLAFYERAKTRGVYPRDAYMMKDALEFFASTGITYLYGTIARPPYTRDAVVRAQPRYAAYLSNLFGFKPN